MICVSIQKTSCEDVLALFESREVEMAELRLDLSEYTVEEVGRLCSRPIPVIATCRCDIAGPSKAERQLSAAIEAGAFFIDMELEMPEPLSRRLYEEARKSGCRVIRSWHDFEGTPDVEVMETRIRECLAGGADIVKIVTTALSSEDSARVLSLYSGSAAAGLEGRLVAFAMGEAGRQSRLDSLRLGAPFTYAGIGGRSTAPGQPDVHELYMQAYGKVSPLRLIDGQIAIPRSKSTLQREIVASALAGEVYEVKEEDICDDTRAALRLASVILENGKTRKKDGFEKQ